MMSVSQSRRRFDLHHFRDLRLLDQLASATANYVPLLVATLFLSAADAGRCFLFLGIYSLGLGVTRSSLGDALLTDSARALSTGPCYFALAVGSLTAIVYVPFWRAQVQSSTITMLLVALSMVVGQLQESIRLQLIAGGRVHSALQSDTLWLLTTTVLCIAAVLRHQVTIESVSIAWAAGSIASATLASGVLLIAKRERASHFWNRHRSLLPSLAALPLLGAATTQLVNAIGLALGAAASVGIVRGAQLAFLPLAFLLNAQQVLRLPEMARTEAVRGDVLRSVDVKLAFAFAGLGLVLAPLAIWRSSPGIAAFVIAVLLTCDALVGFATGQLGLRIRASRRTHRYLNTRLAWAAVSCVGAALAGASGSPALFACALLVASTTGLAAVWRISR